MREINVSPPGNGIEVLNCSTKEKELSSAAMKMLLFVLIPSISLASGPALEFHQALEMALEKSPEYNSLLLNERNSALSSRNAWTQLLPTVDLQAIHLYNEQNTSAYRPPPVHSPWSNQAGVTITENLYDNGESWRNAEIADLNHQLQILNRQSGRSRILINVAKAYYDYSSTAARTRLLEQQLKALRTQFSSIESRYHQGFSSNRDYLRIKAQVQSAEIDLLSQKIQSEQSKSHLRVILGAFEMREFLPIDPLSISPEWSEGYLTAKETLPFQIAEIQSRIAELKLKSVTRTEWPRLAVKGSYNYVIPQYAGSRIAGTDDPFWNLQVSLVLDYRLWDWGRSGRSVTIAENQRIIDENAQNVERLKTTHDLEQLQSQIQTLKDSFRLTQQILKAHQEAFESLSRGYRDGKISYLELITSLNDFYGSRSQDMNLRFNLLKLRLDLAYYQGKVDEVLKIH